MKPHDLGYELSRQEMRLLNANSIFGDVRVRGLLKTFDPASDAGRRAAARNLLYTKLGAGHLAAMHDASPELTMVREERIPILAHHADVQPSRKRPEEMSVIIGTRTLAWALAGIRPYLATDVMPVSSHIVQPEDMTTLVAEFDRFENARVRGQIVAGTELDTAS